MVVTVQYLLHTVVSVSSLNEQKTREVLVSIKQVSMYIYIAILFTSELKEKNQISHFQYFCLHLWEHARTLLVVNVK